MRLFRRRGRGPLSGWDSTTRRINREHSEWQDRRDGWHRSLADREVPLPAQGYWPITLDDDRIRCTYEFADGERCALVQNHGPVDHLNFKTGAIDLVDNDDPRYKSPYGPTGFVREYSAAQFDAFVANAGVIHDHSWMGGEVIHVTNMPGEGNFYEKEWYCQFCGARARGETKTYATTGRSLLPAPERPVSLAEDRPGG